MLPSFAITFNLSIVSLFPTTSDNTRGRYFSTHGSSPSAAGGSGGVDVLAVGGAEEEEDEMLVAGCCFVGDVCDCFLGVDVDAVGCSVSITSSSSSCTSCISSSDMAVAGVGSSAANGRRAMQQWSEAGANVARRGADV